MIQAICDDDRGYQLMKIEAPSWPLKLKALSILFFPAALLGQFVTDDSDGFYRHLYDDGRESILVEYSVKARSLEVGLEMIQNTCSGQTEPFSCQMIIPSERKTIIHVWTKHPDFQKIGHFLDRTSANSFMISPLNRISWRQKGLDSSGGNREDISLACGHFDWMPPDSDSKEEVGIHAMAFQGVLENEQLLNRASVLQYILLLGPALAVINDDGSYRLIEIETLGRIDPFFLLENVVETMEFIFKTADSSICRTIFSTATSFGLNPTPLYDEEILPAVVHREGDTYHIRFLDGITPVVVDKEGDAHQKLYPHLFQQEVKSR